MYHFLNRASQREKSAFRTYDIHKDNNIGEVRELLPEVYGLNRSLLPDETNVLIGYYKNQEQLEWILKNQFYNFRIGNNRGSLQLGVKEVNAKYLLLHGPGETKTTKIFELVNEGPRIFSKQDLVDKNYPQPNGEIYLIYKIEKGSIKEFENRIWDITRLNNFSSFRNSPKPISVSLTELMKVLVR